MAIDKSIDYVEQDGSLNFIKNSKSVTVPKEFKARKNAPATKLAYITADEAKMLKKMKKGTPHKGPKGIPSYDSFGSIDASGRDTGVAGSRVSAAETGGGGSGMSSQDRDDFRSAAIAAGAGQRVNPGFFDSRNTVSAAELARAKAFNPTAFRQNRGGGILNFITSGGLLGNLARGLGQRLGLGKRFNEPTYDMRGLDSVNPVFDDGSNEDLLSLIGTGGITNTVPFDADTFDDDVNLMNTKPRGVTTLYDEFPPTTKSDDNRVLPKNLDLGLPNDLYADAKLDNRSLLEKLLNPELNVDEALEKEEKKRKREQELLEEIMKT